MEVSLTQYTKILQQIFSDPISNTNYDEGYISNIDKVCKPVTLRNDENLNTVNTIIGEITKQMNGHSSTLVSSPINNQIFEFMNSIHEDIDLTTITLPTFSENMKLFFKRLMKYTDYDLMNDEKKYFYTIIGTFLFLMNYKSITLSEFKGDSSNCLFFKAPVVNNSNEKQELFIKSVLYPITRQDNILVDNINGFILNHIVECEPHNPDVQYKNHFMQYIDSFLSIQNVSSRESYWQVDELADVISKDSPFTIQEKKDIYDEHPQAELAHISIFKAINGISMATIIKEAILFHSKRVIQSQVDIQDFNIKHAHYISKLVDFIMCIEEVGTYYGIIHNDLHSGNYFYDIESDSFRMIDLGRMHIGCNLNNEIPRTQTESFEDALQKFIKKDIIANGCIDLYNEIQRGNTKLGHEARMMTYDIVMKHIHKENTNNQSSTYKIQDSSLNEKSIYSGWLSDLITISGNIIHYYIFAKQPLYHEIIDIVNTILYIDFQKQREKWTFRPTFIETNTTANVQSLDVLIDKYCHCKVQINDVITSSQLSDDSKIIYRKLWSYLLDGIFCICLIVNEVYYGTQTTYSFPDIYLYHHFQVRRHGHIILMDAVKSFTKDQLEKLSDHTYISPIQKLCASRLPLPTSGGSYIIKRKKKIMRRRKVPLTTKDKKPYLLETIKGFDKNVDYFTRDYELIVKLNAHPKTSLSPLEVLHLQPNNHIKKRELRFRHTTKIPNPYDCIVKLDYESYNHISTTSDLIHVIEEDLRKLQHQYNLYSIDAYINEVNDILKITRNPNIEGYKDVKKDKSLIEEYLKSKGQKITLNNILRCKLTKKAIDIAYTLETIVNNDIRKLPSFNGKLPSTERYSSATNFMFTNPVDARQMIAVTSGGKVTSSKKTNASRK